MTVKERVPQVFAVGGGRLCGRKAVNAGNYGEITRICAQSVELVKKARAPA
ncbi:MAG: hypothetical protein LBK74_03405 [Treponema sp.]|jgi:2-keto-3-deoxy-6-phosphogluconate aldolase|nr:hypothetical protein [Treponema sp.]